MANITQHNQELARGIKELFHQRDQFIVIGLTGRTGSGCSAAADILASDASSINLPSPACPMKSNEQRKYGIIYEWAKSNWSRFKVISVSSIIFFKISRLDDEQIRSILEKFCSDDCLNRALSIFNDVKNISNSYKIQSIINEQETSNEIIEGAYNFYFNILKDRACEFKKVFSSHGLQNYTKLMQAVGNNIRRSGDSSKDSPDPENIFALPKFINSLLKLGRRYSEIKDEPGYFVIDAIRNPFEVQFFRGRYSAFYLFAITTDEVSRRARLHKHNFTNDAIKDLSEKEYPKKDNLTNYDMLVSQHIGKCLELADIIVENPQDEADIERSVLRKSLIKYVSLIQHPGLVPPNQLERCMQVAITAKLNSGCISRQVGAVVTDDSYSIRAVGWNSVAEGQVPCVLRNVKRIKDQSDVEAFSDFERDPNDMRFKNGFDKLSQFSQEGYSIQGRPLFYCFKSTYNKAINEKNQVHTRALHAEENAFLQITKYGGQGIKRGALFTTASPCELCSKKAYQLGVSEIYYIDPYPGIAGEHILSCGNARPKLNLFTGAVGRAYVQLYQPLVPLKDELDILMSSS